MKKAFISLILVLTMVLTAVPVSVFAGGGDPSIAITEGGTIVYYGGGGSSPYSANNYYAINRAGNFSDTVYSIFTDGDVANAGTSITYTGVRGIDNGESELIITSMPGGIDIKNNGWIGAINQQSSSNTSGASNLSVTGVGDIKVKASGGTYGAKGIGIYGAKNSDITQNKVNISANSLSVESTGEAAYAIQGTLAGRTTTINISEAAVISAAGLAYVTNLTAATPQGNATMTFGSIDVSSSNSSAYGFHNAGGSDIDVTLGGNMTITAPLSSTGFRASGNANITLKSESNIVVTGDSVTGANVGNGSTSTAKLNVTANVFSIIGDQGDVTGLYVQNQGASIIANIKDLSVNGKNETVAIDNNGGTIEITCSEITANSHNDASKAIYSKGGTVEIPCSTTISAVGTSAIDTYAIEAVNGAVITLGAIDESSVLTITGNINIDDTSKVYIYGKASVDGTIINNGNLILGERSEIITVDSIKSGGTVSASAIHTTNGWDLYGSSITNIASLLNGSDLTAISKTGSVNGAIYAPFGTLDLRGVDLRVKTSSVLSGGTVATPTTLDTLKATRVLFGDIYAGGGTQKIKNIILENYDADYLAALGVYYDTLTVDTVGVNATEGWYWNQQYQSGSGKSNYQMYTGFGGTLNINKSLTTGEYINAGYSVGGTGITNLTNGAIINCVDFQNTGNMSGGTPVADDVARQNITDGKVNVNGSNATLNAAALNNHAITDFGTVNLTAHSVLTTPSEGVYSVNYGTDAALTIGALNFKNLPDDTTRNQFRTGDNAKTVIGSLTSSTVGADFYVTGNSESTVNKDGGKAVQYTGDIVFTKYKNSDTVNTKFSMTLDSSDDYFYGSVRGLSSASNRWNKWGSAVNADAVVSSAAVTNMTLNMSDGSRWYITSDSAVKNLFMSSSTINGNYSLTVTGNVTLDGASTITVSDFTNKGIISVDMTGATKAQIKLIDCSGNGSYGTAGENYKFAEGKDNGYTLEIINNDLYAKNPAFETPHVHDGITFDVKLGGEYTRDSFAAIFAGDDDGVVYAYLTENMYTTSSSSDRFEIPTGKALYLCLNGYSVNSYHSNGTFDVEGTLNLYDCDTTVRHYALNNWRADTSAVVPASGTEGVDYITVTGGYITNSYVGSYGTGVWCYKFAEGGDGKFNMYGGNIIGCKKRAVDCGCGTFHMYAGTIQGNTADDGAGVYNNVNLTSFHMHGGKIQYNTAWRYGGGIFNTTGDVTFDGNCYVKNNFIASSSTPYARIREENFFTTTNAALVVEISGAGLSVESQIGVTLYGGSGIFASNAVSADTAKFVSDVTPYAIRLTGTQLELYLNVVESGSATTLPTEYDQNNSKTTIKVTGDDDVAATGLDKIAREKKEANKTVDVDIVLTVTEQTETSMNAIAGNSIETTAIKTSAGGVNVEFVSITLAAVINNVEKAITDAGVNVIEIVIPYDLTGKTLTGIYRYHGGQVQKFTQDSTKSGAEGTYFYENGSIHIFASKFSTYAIAYTPYVAPVPSSPSYDTTTTVAVKKSCPQDATCVYAKFPDADTKAWYHDGVHFCVEKEIMVGYDNGNFGPSDNLSRAMVVQMLYNMENKPAVNTTASFSDVKEGAWYANAVTWAETNCIVTGYGNGLFGPEDDITREQLAKILYGYAKLKGYDVTASADLSEFTDAENTSSWAVNELKWAKAVKLVSGKGNGIIDPTGLASRAEAATMFKNFAENIAK